MMQEAATKFSLLDTILNTCRRFPDKKLFQLRTEEGHTALLTGGTIMYQTELLGSFLQQKIPAQEKVILLLPQGTDYIVSLIACFYANIIVIPVAVPAITENDSFCQRIIAVLKDSGACHILTNDTVKNAIKDLDSYPVSWLSLDHIDPEKVIVEEARKQSEADIAMLLYTSGSTAQPKGVILGHSNLLAQVIAGKKQWLFTEESCIVTWMPQFHSFGLAFNILGPLVAGASCIIMSAGDFLKSPEKWFRMIAEFHATHTAVPNFAIDYCYSAIDTDLLSDISLISLKAIICGGELVRKETWDQFYHKFKEFGLDENVFCPHYGSSETGPVATAIPGQQGNFISLSIAGLSDGKIEYTIHEEKRKFAASCGVIGEGITVLAVNQFTSALCQLGEIGEIWIKSPGTGQGYLTTAEENEGTFSGILSPGKECGFFRTGDLGFVADNQLYIVGRQKEVIIIHGKNHHPADIEWTVKKYVPQQTLPAVAFSCDISLQERVILIQEVGNGLEELNFRKIAQDILSAVSTVNMLEIYEVILVDKGSISRTGSGKVSRKLTKEAYLAGTLAVLYINRSGIGNEISDGDKQVHVPDAIFFRSLKDIFLTVLKLDAGRLAAAVTWSELGLNSIQYIQVAKKIEEVFSLPFTPAMLFKYQSFEKLSEYLDSKLTDRNVAEKPSEEIEAAPTAGITEDDIAIIGLHCQFPGGAADADLFWTNMMQQKDGITGIPEDRDLDGTGVNVNHTYQFPQWGGFIDNIQGFDAEFFGISALEAESMDPQQRKALELVWKVIEDSGYNAHEFSGQPIGVFLGVHNNDYAELVMKQPLLTDVYGGLLDSGLHMSMITHRVSRWFNFHGPSEVINTACSSSLVAIHHAIGAIGRGECTMAIAGGINLMLSSRVYKASHQAGMLAPDGHCKAFDAKADGFVRAEGLGAVLLKPLKQAKKDNDTIYGIIKGIAVNHDGKSNSLRAPNLNAQRQVITSAYRKSGVSPATVSFIEAHGTGTSLGDPIEVQALHEAFKESLPDLPAAFCGLGTVKTNIGHSESAAGIAGLIKVLMAMKYGSLPGIMHFEKLNPFIQLEQSPFYVVGENQEWKRLISKDGTEIPRRAGISSFGFGGANVHMIIEENTLLKETRIADAAKSTGYPVIVPLSAKNKERLKESAQRLLNFLKKSLSPSSENLYKVQNIRLEDVGYTLQTGRLAMEERIVFLVNDIVELTGKLEQYILDEKGIEQCWSGRIPDGQNINPLIEQDEDSRELIHKWFLKGKFNRIAQIWSQGATIEWNGFYKNAVPCRISLPTYPFAATKYWISGQDSLLSADTDLNPITYLHPLLHQNTSNLSVQRYTTTFTGREFFLKDHMVRGEAVLPAVAYLEMVREAITRATLFLEHAEIHLEMKNVVWVMPLIITENAIPVHISLYPAEDGQIEFEVYTETAGEKGKHLTHSRGTVILEKRDITAYLTLDSLLAECQMDVLTADELYENFRTAGIAYGPAFKGMEVAYIGEKQLLVKISLPLSVAGSNKTYILHPGILDAALQAASALTVNPTSMLTLPYAISGLSILDRCTDHMWAWIRYAAEQPKGSAGQMLDIDLSNDQGQVCVQIKGFITRPAKEQDVYGVVRFEPSWSEKTTAITENVYEEHLVIFCEPSEFNENELTAQLKSTRFLVLNANQFAIEQRFESYTVQILEEIRRLLKNRSAGKVLVQLILRNQGEQQLFYGLQGLLKTAHAENPLFIGQCIIVKDMTGIAGKIKSDAHHAADFSIRYQEGKRELMSWSEAAFPEIVVKHPWKDNGIYLITGGAGSLGFIFAGEIAKHVQGAKIILTGRSPLDENKRQKIERLRETGVWLEYREADISKQETVNDLIAAIKDSFGKLNGIIHSAGIIKDNFILKKNSEEVKAVLAPKVGGLVHLDTASQDLSLDFFALFSSVTGSLGNAGQADYSAANAFMDAYSGYRNQLLAAGKRCGKTLSVNWPLWEEGGMKPDAATEEIIRSDLGMMPMSTVNGLHAFYQGLLSGLDQIMVIEGNKTQVRNVITNKLAKPEPEVIRLSVNRVSNLKSVSEQVLEEKTITYLKQLISSVIRTPAEQIDAGAAMEKYGIDSVLIAQLTHQLEKVFGSLSKTLFFEYQNIKELGGYFVQVYRERMLTLLEIGEAAKNVKTVNSIPVQPAVIKNKRFRPASVTSPNSGNKQTDGFDIAIVGLAGKYAGAKNITELWNNLKAGKSSITEVPADRWDWKKYFNPQRGKKGTSYTKWGGFIEDVDKFDPLFFHISPVDAEKMDPQERLFIETAYSSIEDAGYTPKNICEDNKVGVFVGVMHSLYSSESGFWSIANRVSYLFNFQGPSLAVDTACSSSLTALHLAVESLQTGSCDCAIAGGVNLIIDPAQYISLSEMTMVSATDSCKSFGVNADGFVDGEGVGSVVMKPLSKAIADGDHIYGVIKGSKINHGGKTNGYTVPNPLAQANLITEVLKGSGIDAAGISYLEAHGTGTALGDPIEIAGLSKAFGTYTQKKQYCSIGSVKSNIGHCESAAGIAALTKVLLQFKYKQLVPSLHSKELNPNIDFSQTPFVVQQELSDWKRPLIDGIEVPLRAGISSFGAGGANAHLVLEEYVAHPPAVTGDKAALPVLIVISARNKDQLDDQVLQLLLALNDDIPLLSLAYTLQVGRQAMQERIALQVESLEELREKLSGYLSGEHGSCYQGRSNSNKEAFSLFENDAELQQAIDKWIELKKYNKLLEGWVKGLPVEWQKIYSGDLPLRINLPTYPFARERYWLEKAPEQKGESKIEKQKDTADTLTEQVIDELLNGRITISAAADIIKEY